MAVFVTIVLDGVGVGAQPDAAEFGDVGSDTLGHICDVARPHLPNLARWGVGRIRKLSCVEGVASPAADFGRMLEVSAGKDSTSGHWELAGIELDKPFPTYPDGFLEELIDLFLRESGCAGILGNVAASGTDIIDRLGPSHGETGWPIVYTSADSVFQIAAHVDVVPLQRLYEICRVARDRVCIGAHAVGRVIARPFEGEVGAYSRLSSERKDFALPPQSAPLQSSLREAGVETVAVGKIGDLFARVGFDSCVKTRSNREGIEETLSAIRSATASGQPTFIWTNLVDFDQDFGHRNDADGFARALEHFDDNLPRIEDALPGGSVLLLTADHGNDPTFPGTDHTREYVPLLVLYEGSGSDLGVRSTFADHAATVRA
ncbi:MAG: phosphopentomutase, partial [Rhodothermales bacterium]|nr:phosphopentomutase [Rhodothermales bacterium]